MKGPKALMKNNHTEDIKEAYMEAVKPELTQLRGQFVNCMFTNNKMKTYTPIKNEHIVEEMMNLSTKFKFLPENLENCKSSDVFKKLEEDRALRQPHYRSNM